MKERVKTRRRQQRVESTKRRLRDGMLRREIPEIARSIRVIEHNGLLDKASVDSLRAQLRERVSERVFRELLVEHLDYVERLASSSISEGEEWYLVFSLCDGFESMADFVTESHSLELRLLDILTDWYTRSREERSLFRSFNDGLQQSGYDQLQLPRKWFNVIEERASEK